MLVLWQLPECFQDFVPQKQVPDYCITWKAVECCEGSLTEVMLPFKTSESLMVADTWWHFCEMRA